MLANESDCQQWVLDPKVEEKLYGWLSPSSEMIEIFGGYLREIILVQTFLSLMLHLWVAALLILPILESVCLLGCS